MTNKIFLSFNRLFSLKDGDYCSAKLSFRIKHGDQVLCEGERRGKSFSQFIIPITIEEIEIIHPLTVGIFARVMSKTFQSHWNIQPISPFMSSMGTSSLRMLLSRKGGCLTVRKDLVQNRCRLAGFRFQRLELQTNGK